MAHSYLLFLKKASYQMFLQSPKYTSEMKTETTNQIKISKSNDIYKKKLFDDTKSIWKLVATASGKLPRKKICENI